jgi:hypothetical protein
LPSGSTLAEITLDKRLQERVYSPKNHLTLPLTSNCIEVFLNIRYRGFAQKSKIVFWQHPPKAFLLIQKAGANQHGNYLAAICHCYRPPRLPSLPYLFTGISVKFFNTD